LKIAEHQECNYFGNDKKNATISSMTKVIHKREEKRATYSVGYYTNSKSF
jgi:hypothetical protein